MKNNFLNAQNYILGKTEKKKLLSKFFVERFLKKFYKILSWFKYYFVTLFIIFFIIYIIIKLLIDSLGDDKNPFLFILLIFLYYIFNYIKKNGIKLKVKTIKNLKQFFLKNSSLLYHFNHFINFIFNENTYKKFNKNLIKTRKLYIYFSHLLYLIITPIILYKSIYILNFSNEFKILLFSILYILFCRINLYSVLLFPFFIIIMFFVSLYSLIYTFIIKGTKSYKFLKYKPQTKFFEKFKTLEKNLGKNKSYLVKLKK